MALPLSAEPDSLRAENPMIRYRRDLWRLIEGVSGDAAEIGVAEGNFSRDILSWPIQIPKVYLVDRWACAPLQRGDAANPQEWHEANYAAARAKMEPFGTRAVFLRGDSVTVSEQVPDRSLRLCYIDADHSYEGVTADLVAWHPKLVPEGVMAFHDFRNPSYGVKRAVLQFAFERWLEVYEIPEDKDEDAGAWFWVT